MSARWITSLYYSSQYFMYMNHGYFSLFGLTLNMNAIDWDKILYVTMIAGKLIDSLRPIDIYVFVN